MRIFSILFFLFFLLQLGAKAQFFQTGQDPSSVHWRQINTEQFQVIYPEEFEKEAQRISFILEKVYQYGWKTLNFHPRKISVVLHTRTVNSNGLVAWAPKRIELFTTPNQQIYSQEWLEQLSLHEFRHLVQLDKIQSELPGLVKAILGEQATALVTGVYLPFWFLEGDAVATETALSKSGRGRMASFSMEYRAQMLEKGKYSFDKAYLGSFKDFVPDHYRLGYFMVAKTRERFGQKVWENALNKIGNQPFSLTPLNSSLKKSTGLGAKKLYSGIFDELRQNWKDELLNRRIDSIQRISPNKKFYSNYLYPEIYNDSLIFAYRTSIDDIGRFVLITPGKSEKVIYTPGYVFEESVSLRNNLVIWAEMRPDIRWSHSDRSVIQVYNIETKAGHEIKPENKLFSPVISPDLKSFAAVEVDPENDFYLSVFDLETGKVKERFKTPDNHYFFTPCWDETGDKLFVVCLSPKGKYLASFDLNKKQLEALTPCTFANLKNPYYSNGKIVFSADFSGTDQLYSLETKTAKVFQIASVLYGADYPSFNKNGNQLFFSNYTSGGYQIARLNLLSNAKQLEVGDIQLRPDSLAEHLAKQEVGIPDFGQAHSAKYVSSKYSKITHLFNFHSWAPAYIDVNSYETRPGFSLFSQNKLGTAETRLGYDYNVSDRTGQFKISFNYSGWFPEISTELITGNQASNYYQVNNTVNSNHEVIKSDTTIQRYKWNETSASLDLRIPLNFSKGRFSRILNPEVQYKYNQVSQNSATPANFYSGDYHALTYRIFFYNLLNQSNRSIMPKWGQQFDLIYRHTPIAGNNLGTLAGIQSAFYFPGIMKNDGLKIYQGYQEKVFTKTYNFSDFVRFPRGFQSYQNNKMYSLALDYRFPFLYPDFSLGKLAYIKRLKAAFFYDFAWLSVPAHDDNGKIYLNYHELNMKSLGIELTSDLHILRFFAPLGIGIRTTYRPDYQDIQYNLLVSIDFNGF
jgi:hypothetical protein